MSYCSLMFSVIFCSNEPITGETAIARYLARLHPSSGLYGNSNLEKTEVRLFL